MMKARTFGKQRGLWLAEAAVGMFVVTIVIAAAMPLVMDLSKMAAPAAEDAALAAMATTAREALRITGEYPPCGATLETPGTCSIPDDIVPAHLEEAGYEVRATATAATFDPDGQTGTTAAGDFYAISGTARSPRGRVVPFHVMVAMP